MTMFTEAELVVTSCSAPRWRRNAEFPWRVKLGAPGCTGLTFNSDTPLPEGTKVKLTLEFDQ